MASRDNLLLAELAVAIFLPQKIDKILNKKHKL